MITKYLSNLCLILALLSSYQVTAVQQYSGINRVTFYDESKSKDFVGNGFPIEYQGKAYAVTVKHALFELGTPEITTIDISEHVSNWQIHPNGNLEQSVTLGKLLNKSISEKLDMEVLQKDWLVFEIDQNNSNLSLLSLRDSPLQEGEVLTAYGCSYANKTNCTQDSYPGKFIEMDGANLRISLENMNPGTLRGLSGSPVLDDEGRVVGIVSNLLPSKTTDGFDFAPASLEYLKQVLVGIVGG